MSCFFCKKTTHISEYCRDFDSYKSRNSIIFSRGQRACLCPKYEPINGKENAICKCKIICAVCFQHHHIAMCPKRDFDHPSFSIIFPEPLSLFSHHSPFVKRFFECCNLMDQYKLQKTCKYFMNFKPIDLKLEPNFRTRKFLPPNNIVFNKNGTLVNRNNLNSMAFQNKYRFNFDNITFDKCEVTIENLKFFAKSDPNTVTINYCIFDCDFEFHDILDIFPYASRFYIKTYQDAFAQRTLIPGPLILNFLCTVRKVEVQEIHLDIDGFVDFNIDELVILFGKNPNLILYISARYPRYTTFISQLENHARLFDTDPNGPFNLRLNFFNDKTKFWYKYQ